MLEIKQTLVRLKHLDRLSKRECEDALMSAVYYLRNFEKTLDIVNETYNNIGNKYIFHADSELNDFDQGYNAGIRDALAILRKDVTT